MVTLWRRISARGTTCLLVVALTAVVTVWLRNRVPVEIRPGQSIDDGLFVRGAGHLSHGEWLGPVNHLTLSKGIGYPAFIAWTHGLGLQLKPAEQIVYLLAVGSLALTVKLLTGRSVAATAVFVVLAFSPLSFGYVGSLLLREGFYASLTLLLVGLLALTVLCVVQGRNVLWALLGAVATGAVFAEFAVTREETVWILPALVLLVAGLVLTARPTGSRRATALRALRVGLVLAAAVGVSAIPVRHVEQRNLEVYGVEVANDTTEGEFARMYTDWSAVRAGPVRQYVPIPASSRDAVYAISPSAREIHAALDETGKRWFLTSCRNVGVCDDFSGGFMVWALREATADAGYFGTGEQSQAFFGRIADDIEKACREGDLTCDLPSNPIAGAVGGAHPDRVWASTVEGFRYVVFDTTMTVDRWAEQGVRPVTPEERRFTHSVISDIPVSQLEAEAEVAAFTGSDGAYDALTEGYRYLLPALLVTLLLGLAAACVLRPRAGFALAAFVVTLTVAAGTRLVVLAVVDSTAFQASERFYQGVTYALLLAAGTVGTVLLGDVVARWWSGRREARVEAEPGEAVDVAAAERAIIGASDVEEHR